MSSRRQAAEATVSLVQLRNCLVNLPSSLTSLLSNANTPPQNVVVEVQFRSARFKTPTSQPPASQSIFLGWSGHASKPRPSLTSTRQPSQDASYAASTGPSQGPTVEIDSAFARTLGLDDGTKVQLFPHLEPALAHTVHIEPLTPSDWEIIELHATFLETNLQAQIRALPNPSFVAPGSQNKDKSEGQTQTAHPLTIHLSPTSTANVIVTQLNPPVPKDVAFAKLSPDAEVIVAPKTRPKVAGRGGKGDSRSVMSGSVRSARTSGTARQRTARTEAKKPLFVRGIDQDVCPGLIEFEDEDDDEDTALQIMVDAEVLASSKSLRGADIALVSIVRPAGLQPAMDAQQMQKWKDFESGEAGLGATKVIAHLKSWNDAPTQTCAVLSPQLSEALGVNGQAGSIIRLEAVPPPSSTAKTLKIFPFAGAASKQAEGLKFGGETRASRDSAAQRLRTIFGKKGKCNILNGPVTDGLILPKSADPAEALGWNGGIVRLNEVQTTGETEKPVTAWILAKEDGIQIEVQAEIASPLDVRRGLGAGDEPISSELKPLVEVDDAMLKLVDHARYGSATLLNGGLGSGKTLVAQHLATRLQSEHLYNVAYFPCRKLVTDETRVSAIKDTFTRLFMQAAWCARLGGKSLVVLDDLDKLCPSEQELQVGNDNARSRQISELLCAIVKQYCGPRSGVMLVATAQGKEALHDTVVGGHILPETVDLKAPNKDRRRRILDSLVSEEKVNKPSKATQLSATTNGTPEPQANGAWMDNSAPNSRPTSSYQQEPTETPQQLDLLDIAGQTDGYMPGDLYLLFARAKSEALIRTVSDTSNDEMVRLTQKDFERALEGFTPASLRNVTLQSSSTTFSSIGGLQETRKTLLETLQYPTTYAPIFAQCPLRLRSGLLLYGYPGCGKTLLASAVAGECGLNFISVKGPEILNKYIGASEKSVRDLFERAQAARPCVLFFDEFDSIAPKRGHDSTGVTDRVVNQLLTQMDGAEGLSGVYVLAATSRPDLIDPALLRPGRLDKSLLCDMPSEEDRLDILRALSTKLKIQSSIAEGAPHSPYSLHEVARRSEGYSGADLQAVVYNAHLEAIHDVLDDASPKSPTTASTSGKSARSSSTRRQSTSTTSSSTRPEHHHSLIQFRYGLEEDRKAAAALTGPKAASEHAALLAKLEAQRAAKRKEREARRGGGGHGMSSSMLLPNGTDAKDGKDDVEVVIGWNHLERSLATTRSSISAAERGKLRAIYNEFVQGRNGEMPSGQGPMEVGARSSLM